MIDPIQQFYDKRPYPLLQDTQAVPANPAPPAASVIHHAFGGVVPTQGPLRILVAGGGSGMGLVQLGVGFRHLGIETEITYLDISPRSRETATKRAASTGLTGITFRTGNIEDLKDGPAALFDYIDFCGVINHVADHARTVEALAHVLAENGSIGCMAYGATGRIGIYEFQEMVFKLLGPEPDIALTRELLKSLPSNNWLRKSPLYDHLVNADDTELADALINPRDRAFSTDDLRNLFGEAGLRHLHFVPPMLYDPAAMLKNADLTSAAKGLPEKDRLRVGELLIGDLNKHFFFAHRNKPTSPFDTALNDETAILFQSGNVLFPDPSELKGETEIQVSIKTRLDGRERTVGARLTVTELEIARRLAKPVSIADLRAGIPAEEFAPAFERIYRLLTGLDMLHVVSGASR